MDLDALLDVVATDGMLLLSDPVLPSVVSLVAGAPIGGSWWGHARSDDIYRLANELADQPSILLMKLVSGKVTYVHRRLWPAVLAVALARAAWQMDQLSATALDLLRLVDDAGDLTWDAVPSLPPFDARAATGAAKELEQRLLLHATEVHTVTGAHARNLETWAVWAASVGAAPPYPDVAVARQELEQTLEDLNQHSGARARLPWSARHVRRARAGRIPA